MTPFRHLPKVQKVKPFLSDFFERLVDSRNYSREFNIIRQLS